jgi:KamA family protein
MLSERPNRRTRHGTTTRTSPDRSYRAYSLKDLDRLPHLQHLAESDRRAMRAVARVLPFRVNNYVIEDLIDWSDIPDDPIYQLTFPQPGMLDKDDFLGMLALERRGASAAELKAAARAIQHTLNPHPAGQVDLNVPVEDGRPLDGMQHKYRETVLFFPAAGQTCHAYCTYCFRWAQFAGLDELKFASRQAEQLVEYVKRHPEITSVLITGGDPLVMRTKVLRRFIEPLLDPALEHLKSIRIGTKAPAYWPYRFVSDPDADDLARLFEHVRARGKPLALMAHYSHPRELSTPIAERAIRRIQDTGATVRCQAPLIRHVNDSAQTWAEMWSRQVQLGAVPYYMFVERDTGPRHYFEVPLARANRIFSDAYATVSGLGRTVRGPTMSATAGKLLVVGITDVAGETVFVLKFLQARKTSWVNRVFFAAFDPDACWITDLKPAFGETEFFFEASLRKLRERRRTATVVEPGMRPRTGEPASRR